MRLEETMNFISLETAKKILDFAFKEAKERGVHNAAVVVTDVGGNIRAAQRSDSFGNFGTDVALAKARTALGFSNSSLKIGEIFSPRPSTVVGLNGAVHGQFLPLGGGVVVKSESGDIIGGAAYAGGAPETDHAIIVAAVKSVGLVPTE